MLSRAEGWTEMVELNPPRLPNMTHLALRGRWRNVLITDNPFKQVRVSPYAFAARITHDVPEVRPTVVCSTRDRNILAIESEVRGAIANGVDSQLMWGSDYPHVEGTFVNPEGRDMPSVTRLALRNTFCDVAPDRMRRMVGGNLIDVFDLDRDALQRIASEIDAPTAAEIAEPIDAVPAGASTHAFRSGNGPWM